MEKDLHVLVIEDSSDDILLLMDELKRNGYNPHHYRAEKKEEMLCVLWSKDLDVIIADHSLPEFDSLAALKVLQSTGRDIPFIIFSGQIGEETVVKAMKEGASDYVSKENMFRLVPAIKREIRDAQIRNERKKEAARKRFQMAFLSRLAEITKLEEALEFSLKSIMEYTSMETGAIRLKSEEDYYITVHKGFSQDFLDSERFLLVNNTDGREQKLACLCGLVLAGEFEYAEIFNDYGSLFIERLDEWLTEHETLLRQSKQPLRLRCLEEGFQTLVLVPIKAGKDVIGLLHLNHRSKGALPRDELAFLEYLTRPLGYALKQFQDRKTFQFLSYHDKLTGLYNRAFLEEKMSSLEQSGLVPVCIIMGDINGLKLVNNTFGHQEGDRLLAAVGKALKESLREGDLVCRWGGDEFALLLPGLEESECLQVGARIKKAVEELREGPLPVTVALGSASNRNKMSLQEVLREAEERMYRNKLLENMSFRSSTLRFLKRTLFEKSNETENHASRMRELALEMGKVLKLSESKMDELVILAALHDIGKIAIPESIIKKPGPLTPKEWETIKKHPEIGYRVAEGIPELFPIACGILSHHEWWDGTGYPQGLIGEDIPLIARIIAIVDAFDVMVKGRARTRSRFLLTRH